MPFGKSSKSHVRDVAGSRRCWVVFRSPRRRQPARFSESPWLTLPGRTGWGGFLFRITSRRVRFSLAERQPIMSVIGEATDPSGKLWVTTLPESMKPPPPTNLRRRFTVSYPWSRGDTLRPAHSAHPRITQRTGPANPRTCQANTQSTLLGSHPRGLADEETRDISRGNARA